MSSLYLIYKRLRAPFGIPMGFVIMYGVFVGGFSSALFAAAIGFFFIELFAALYNDYWDYEEDMMNSRKDKLTTSGAVSRHRVRLLSFASAGLGLLSLFFSGLFPLLLGVYFILMGAAYSHPRVRLKGSVGGYSVLASVYLLLPFSLGAASGSPGLAEMLLGCFFFFQYMYILCQKDSTDSKDRKNLFVSCGWGRSSRITAAFAAASSGLLLALCVIHPVFFLLWAFNAALKVLNATKIWSGTITRGGRSRIILGEFFTPYLFLGGVFLG